MDGDDATIRQIIFELHQKIDDYIVATKADKVTFEKLLNNKKGGI